MGVSKSCPNIALYGDSGEIPLSLKGYRLTLNYWHRLTELTDDSLAKIALRENAALRTNWIITIEKLIDTLKLSDKIGNHYKFKNATKTSLESGWRQWWKLSLENPQLSRLKFYQKIKDEYGYEGYLNTQNFEKRRLISKLRCSDHVLEIEKGRHKQENTRKPVEERKCIYCKKGEVEDEKHFLFSCDLYAQIRNKYPIPQGETSDIFSEECLPILTHYIYEAFKLRESTEVPEKGQGRGGDVVIS